MSSGRIIRKLSHILPVEDVVRVALRLIGNDGGPGSGNWGHKGRPGLVGGSGPGGGSQYRGGRSDIGFFGSRKDWMNGLSGEKQAKAARFMKTANRVKNEFAQAKEAKIKNLEKLKTQGLLTQKEVDERIKSENLDKYDPDMTAEAYIMKVDTSISDKKSLLDMVGEARNWEKNGDKLQKDNLTPEEQNALSWFTFEFDLHKEKDGEPYLTDEEMYNNNLDRVFDELTDAGKKFYLDMKAKACGLPDSGTSLREHKEKIEAELKPVKKDFDWFGPDCQLQGWERHTHFPMMIQLAAGVSRDEAEELKTNEDIESALQKMVNVISVAEKPSLHLADEAMNFAAKAKGIDWRAELKNAVSGAKIEGLTQEESDELCEILKKRDFDKDIDKHPDWIESTYIMGGSGAKVDDEARRYALLKAKALGLPDPESKEVIEERERKEKEAKAQKIKDFVDGGKARIALYENAETRFKVKQLLESTGVFKKNAPVMFDSIDLQCAKKAAIYADKFFQRFPFLYGKINGIDNKESGKNTYACCHRMSDDGRVSLNPAGHFYGSEQGIINTYNEDVRTGFHPPHTTYEAVVTHEFAHALGGWLTRNKVFGSEYGTEGKSFESKLRLSVLRKLKMKKADVIRELSRYADKDSYEWFAEAMAEALHSPNPRPMATECFRQLNEILQKEGLIDGPIQRIL